MEDAMQKLPDAELDIMLALWQANEAVPRAYFDNRLKHRKWSANTVNTLLGRLQEKDFLACERRGRENYYTPLIQRDAYLEFESSSMLQKLYGNSVKNFVLSLAHTDVMDDADITELQQYLAGLRKEESHD
jgi:predicted transcriptional regulator